jgi:hypothetical protein
MTNVKTFKGSCLCGGVSYEFEGMPDGVICCHCTQCRKQTGHHFATVEADKDKFHLTRDATLEWYQASPIARRGFCKACGSTLFWDEYDAPAIDILAGSIDGTLGLSVKVHLHVAEKGDYYDIPDDVPHYPAGRKG